MRANESNARGTARLTVSVNRHGVRLTGDLAIPDDPSGIVAFVHGAENPRPGAHSRIVADSLQADGYATLLMGLFTEDERSAGRRAHRMRVDVPMLADRLVTAIEQISGQEPVRGLPLGLLGVGGGAAVALVAAARHISVRAVVSLSGRPDLARDALDQVRAPTLLIVGDPSKPVHRLNQLAAEHMAAPMRIDIVHGASHFVDEPRPLRQVAQHVTAWFDEYLRRPDGAPHPEPPRFVASEDPTAPLSWTGWPRRLEHLAHRVVEELKSGRTMEALTLLDAIRTEVTTRHEAVAGNVENHGLR